jgi:hypothetical protein
MRDHFIKFLSIQNVHCKEESYSIVGLSSLLYFISKVTCHWFSLQIANLASDLSSLGTLKYVPKKYPVYVVIVFGVHMLCTLCNEPPILEMVSWNNAVMSNARQMVPKVKSQVDTHILSPIQKLIQDVKNITLNWQTMKKQKNMYHDSTLLTTLTVKARRNTYGSYQSLPWGTSREL